MSPNANPFGLTKANDLSDAQIQSLWVDIAENDDDEESLVRLARPSSAMPTFILGGKGSGKTHLMRYCSYQIQKIRFAQRDVPLLTGLAGDRYIGIYVKLTGLNTGRFTGKQLMPEAWVDVFSYYVELWFGQALLRVVVDILQSIEANAYDEKRICERAADLFDANPPTARTLEGLLNDLVERQRKLDFAINNAAFSRSLEPGITLTRGRLVFGLPQVLAEEVQGLKNLQFTYQLDEFENLSELQQRHVNTLVREREQPATFKIGSRQFGVKTRLTFCDEEENIKDSEFEELRLDQRFRANEKAYARLATRLIAKRLEGFTGASPPTELPARKLEEWFVERDLQWNSPYFRELVGDDPSASRAHVERLKSKLKEASTGEEALRPRTALDAERLTERLYVADAPLLEKLNVLLLYSSWSKGNDLDEESKTIAEECQAFIEHPRAASRYYRKLDHFKSDLIAQMLRDNKRRTVYAGLPAFIRMSEGQPRALITLLKHTYDWAVFQGAIPFVDGLISEDAQTKGAMDAAEWFYNSMTKAGTGGRDILIATDRLAELFRINRFSDNLVESSLIGFSASLHEANEAASEVIRLATERSFLVEIVGGQQERNSERITTKLQLNRMLVPRWGLATARRGIAAFRARELNAIFDPRQEDEFKALANEWTEKRNAPFAARSARGGASPTSKAARQADLFGS